MKEEILLFLGAGASKPFEIPTMKEMVTDFEDELRETGLWNEQELYKELRILLTKKLNHRPDLEEIFSVIEEISNDISFKKLNGASYFYHYRYFSHYFESKMDRALPPVKKYRDLRKTDIVAAKILKERFEEFIRKKCVVDEKYADRISKVYSEFFDYLVDVKKIVFKSKRKPIQLNSGVNVKDDHYYKPWPIFTTNYDRCIETYWEETGIDLNTGFEWDSGKRMSILNYEKFNNGGLKLFKLHGSVNWLVLDDESIVEEYGHIDERRPYRGRKKIKGKLMIYPTGEKYMFREPFFQVFYHLDRNLKTSNCWVVIGYSFGDFAIRSLFLDNAKENKKFILIHPEGKRLVKKYFNHIKCEVVPIEGKFGSEDIIQRLNDEGINPK